MLWNVLIHALVGSRKGFIDFTDFMCNIESLRISLELVTSKSLLEVISNANNMSLVEKIDGDDVDDWAEKTDDYTAGGRPLKRRHSSVTTEECEYFINVFS